MLVFLTPERRSRWGDGETYLHGSVMVEFDEYGTVKLAISKVLFIDDPGPEAEVPKVPDGRKKATQRSWS